MFGEAGKASEDGEEGGVEGKALDVAEVELVECCTISWLRAFV